MKKFKVTVEDGILGKQTEYEVFAVDGQKADEAMSPLVRSGPYKVVKVVEVIETPQPVNSMQETIEVHSPITVPCTPGEVDVVEERCIHGVHGEDCFECHPKEIAPVDFNETVNMEVPEETPEYVVESVPEIQVSEVIVDNPSITANVTTEDSNPTATQVQPEKSKKNKKNKKK